MLEIVSYFEFNLKEYKAMSLNYHLCIIYWSNLVI